MTMAIHFTSNKNRTENAIYYFYTVFRKDYGWKKEVCGKIPKLLLGRSFLLFIFLEKPCNKELTFVFLGCEDIVADQISVENLVMILNWSSEPHGSSWVHRQALHFLKEEFLNVMHSPVLFDLSKQYLIQAIRSDFLQVSVQMFLLCVKKNALPLKCIVIIKIKSCSLINIFTLHAKQLISKHSVGGIGCILEKLK